jgi:hypothetical protein
MTGVTFIGEYTAHSARSEARRRRPSARCDDGKHARTTGREQLFAVDAGHSFLFPVEALSRKL